MAAPASAEDQWTFVSPSISSSSDCSDDDHVAPKCLHYGVPQNKVIVPPPMSYPPAPLESPASSDDEGFVLEAGDEVTVHIEQDGWLHALRSIHDDAKPSSSNCEIEDDDIDKRDADAPLHDIDKRDGDEGKVSPEGVQYVCDDSDEIDGSIFDDGFDPHGGLFESYYLKLTEKNSDQGHLNVQATAVVQEDGPHTEHGEDDVSLQNLGDVRDLDEGASELVEQENMQQKERKGDASSVMAQEEEKLVAAETLPHAHHEVHVSRAQCEKDVAVDVAFNVPHEKAGEDAVGIPHDFLHETGDDDEVHVQHKGKCNELFLEEPHLEASEMVGQVIMVDLTEEEDKAGNSEQVETEHKEPLEASPCENAEENQNYLLSETVCKEGLGAMRHNAVQKMLSPLEAVKEELASWEECHRKQEAVLARIKAERHNEEDRLERIVAQLEERREHIKALESLEQSEHEKENTIVNQRPKSQAEHTCDIIIGSAKEMISNNGCSTHETPTPLLQTRKAGESRKKQAKTVRNQSTSNAQAKAVRNQSTLNAQAKAVKQQSTTNAHRRRGAKGDGGTGNDSNQTIRSYGFSFLSLATIMETLGRLLASCCNCLDGLAGRAESRARRYLLEPNQTSTHA